MPEIIYLQIEDDLGSLAEPDNFGQCTWCVDKINNSDIKYILYEKKHVRGNGQKVKAHSEFSD